MEMDTDESVDMTGPAPRMEGIDIPETIELAQIGNCGPVGEHVSEPIVEPIETIGTDFPWPLKKPIYVRQQETDHQEAGAVSYSQDSYDMGHTRRGTAVIINQQHFSSALRAAGLNKRTGTDVDGKSLRTRFKALGFDVEMYNDIRARRMEEILAEVADEDHSDADCFVCAILSHGEEGIVYGTDKSIEIKDLLGYFKGDKCQSLAGKPKIFFIQACRGSQMDHGAGVNVADAFSAPDGDVTPMSPGTLRIPIEADFLIAYSTVSGFYSWRNGSNGSWFVQALTEMLETYGETVELQHLLVKVNKIVSQCFESNSNQISFSNKKQIPCITSMLTKDIYLKRK